MPNEPYASVALTFDDGPDPVWTPLVLADLESVLRRHGIPIDRLLSFRVTTSARLEGRAAHGLSYDLSRIAISLRGEQHECQGVSRNS